MISDIMQLDPARIHAAKLQKGLDQQKRQINELNKLIWLLVKSHGGKYNIEEQELMNFPPNWFLSIDSYPEEKKLILIADLKTQAGKAPHRD